MFIVVSGGSGSGKSAYAENRVLEFGETNRIYIATMIAYGEEGQRRVRRHRELRRGKGFLTIEQPLGLCELSLSESMSDAASPDYNNSIHTTVLLECMSNLAANELFDEHGSHEDAFAQIEAGIDSLLKQCDNLVVVTNEVFSDGEDYNFEMQTYLSLLGKINCMMAAKADEVIEVVCGIPIMHKAYNV